MNHKKIFVKVAATTFLATATMNTASAQQGTRPNVLFLFADDMTYEGIAATGNSEISTPNLDRLVKGGTSFMNAYNMGGWHGAISMASRSMLLTGAYVWNTKKLQDNKYQTIYNEGMLWPQVMKQAGYNTFMTGKWHLNHVSPSQVFDETADVRPGGMPGQHPSMYNRPLSETDNSWTPWDKSTGGYWQGDKHWTEVQADDAIQYISAQKGKEHPFFMYVAFNAPHDPRQSPQEYVDMYDINKITVPDDFQPEHPMKELLGCPTTLRDEKLAPFPRTEYAVRKHRQEYYAIISHLDAQVGRILDELKATGQDKNTIIVFAADNGLACGHHGLLGKQSMYEHSMRVPLIFYGTGIPAGKKSHALVYMQDLVPTIYEMTGIEKPAGVQFQSLCTSLAKPSARQRDAVYGTFTNINQRMIRDERYKLFFIPKAKTAYLFDLRKDPNEMNNLYNNKKYNTIVRKLAQRYVELAKETGDTLNLAKYYPALFK